VQFLPVLQAGNTIVHTTRYYGVLPVIKAWAIVHFLKRWTNGVVDGAAGGRAAIGINGLDGFAMSGGSCRGGRTVVKKHAYYSLGTWGRVQCGTLLAGSHTLIKALCPPGTCTCADVMFVELAGYGSC